MTRLLIYSISAVLLLCAIGTGCAVVPNGAAPQDHSGPVLLFRSGFEADTAIEQVSATSDKLVGADRSVAGNNNWTTIAPDTNGRIHGGKLNYNPGDWTCRQAIIAPDPTAPDNRVLRLRGVPSPESPKFRIQADFTSPVQQGFKEFSCSVRLNVPETMAALRDYPKAITWLTVAEFWNDSAWTSREDTEHAFRVTVGIGKDAGAGEELYFRISTDDFSHTGTGANRKYKQIHLEVERAAHFPIPFDTWLTLEYHFRDGDQNEGLFRMAATPAGGERQEICTLHSIMHSPQNPDPKGVTYWAPIKMYTSATLAAWMQSQGRELELLFDDLAIWTGPPPGRPEPDAGL